MFKVFKIMLYWLAFWCFSNQKRGQCFVDANYPSQKVYDEAIQSMAMHSFHTYTSAYIYMLLHVRAPFYVYACSMGRTIIHVRYECLRHLHCTMYNGREKLILWINRNRVNMTRHKIKCMLWSWFTGLPHQQIKSYLPLTLNMEMIN